MDGFDAYKMWWALKQHLTTKSYDYVKFHGKSKITMQSYLKLNYRYFFHKLAKRYDKELEGFFIAAMIHSGHDTFIGELTEQEFHEVYLQWLGRLQRITRILHDDLETILYVAESNGALFKGMFIPKQGELPPVVRMANEGLISYETLAILQRILNFTAKVETINPLWDDEKLKLEKYSKLLRLNSDVIDECKRIVITTIKN